MTAQEPFESPVVYRIDGEGMIRYVNEQWDVFANENDGGNVVSSRVLGQSIWPFLSDATVRDLYQRMTRVAAGGRTITFQYRCDSPLALRILKMTIRPVAHGQVEFASLLKRRVDRARLALLDSRQARSGRLLRICGWCHRVAAGSGRWIELEDAAQTLGLFMDATIPTLTHGICDGCRNDLLAQLAN
jgi:hypothetical protein